MKKDDLNIQVVHCKGDKEHYYVGRPNVLGNPFTHKENTKAEVIVATRNEAVAEYKKYILNKIKEKDKAVLAEFRRLKNEYYIKNRLSLGCWCYPAACHGDVLKEILIKSIKRTEQIKKINHTKFFILSNFELLIDLGEELIFDSNNSEKDLIKVTPYKDMNKDSIFMYDTLEVTLKDGSKIITKVDYAEHNDLFVFKLNENYYPLSKLPFDRTVKIDSVKKINTSLKDIEGVPLFLYDKVELLLPDKSDELVEGIIIYENNDYKIKTNKELLNLKDYLVFNKSSWLDKLS